MNPPLISPTRTRVDRRNVASLRTWLRASLIAGLLAAVHRVLYVVLRVEEFALLAGSVALFVAVAAVMFFTCNINWRAHDAGTENHPEAAR